jgi:hypothetical protein
MIFQIVLLLVSLVILGMTIAIFHKVNQSSEQFENCVGVQYNGLHFLENKKAPLFTYGYKSRYPDGGLLVYDAEQVPIDYDHGKFKAAV